MRWLLLLLAIVIAASCSSQSADSDARALLEGRKPSWMLYCVATFGQEDDLREELAQGAPFPGTQEAMERVDELPAEVQADSRIVAEFLQTEPTADPDFELPSEVSEAMHRLSEFEPVCDELFRA